jgi:hypothetical protein
MWNSLITPNQLTVNSRVRKIVHEGSSQHVTECLVTHLGQQVFLLMITSYNNQILVENQQSIMPYSITNIQYYGLEIWTD